MAQKSPSFLTSGPGFGAGARDPVDIVAGETIAITQIRLIRTESKLWRDIEDALTWIRERRFGVCEECGEPISQARLEAAPWARHCKSCKVLQGPKGWAFDHWGHGFVTVERG
jgi:RNA polymerase-binding transcription factor DksA